MCWEKEEDWVKAKREVPKLASKRSQHQDTGRTLRVLMNTFLLHSERCQASLLGWEKEQGFQTAAVSTCQWVSAEQREAEISEVGHRRYLLLNLA